MSGGKQRSKLNHVAILASDLLVSEEFYCEVLGCERLPSPNFGFPVRWLRLGDHQLHLQRMGSETASRNYAHFAVQVEDFMGAFNALKARGAFESGTRYADVWLLPSGELQMFVRDPSGNMVEIDYPDASEIDLAAFGDQLRVLSNEEPQTPEELSATLFLTPGQAV